MSKEKLLVLQMLKEGKISEEEALKLLEAMGEDKNTKKNIGENKFKFWKMILFQRLQTQLHLLEEEHKKPYKRLILRRPLVILDLLFQNLRERLNKYLTTIWKRVEMLIQLVENYNGKITIHGLEDEEEELDEKKDPLDLEFAEGDDFNLNEEESKEDKKEESKGKSPNNIRANIKIFYDDRLNSNKNNRYFDMTKEGSTLIIKPLNEYFRIDSFEANIDLYLPKSL